MKAKDTYKRSFLRELMLLCKRYDLMFDEGSDGECIITQFGNSDFMSREDFFEWLENADDYEATALEKKKEKS